MVKRTGLVLYQHVTLCKYNVLVKFDTVDNKWYETVPKGAAEKVDTKVKNKSRKLI